MPLYEYRCDDCGTFSAIRKMSESSLQGICKNCGAASERIISASHFALVGKDQRVAHERNEKSAHEPRVGRRSSCGCAGAHTCKTNANGEKNGAVQKVNPATGTPALQMQTKKTARPWMLGH